MTWEGLKFTTFDVRDEGSWARLVRSTGARSGIYVLVEAEMVQHLEAQGWSLTNKLLARRPLGRAIETVVVEGHIIALPWDRPDIHVEEPPARSRPGGPTHRAAYAEASKAEWFPTVVSLLATVVANIIPAPTETAGTLWTLSLLPSTGRTRTERRLVTLNAGGLEILRVREFVLHSGERDYLAVLNLALPENDAEWQFLTDQVGRSAGAVFPMQYSSVGTVLALETTMADIEAAVAVDGPIRDLAYRLVVGRMRAGNTALSGRAHHHRLIRKVLVRAREQGAAEAARGSPERWDQDVSAP